jgi:hypothetical protein
VRILHPFPKGISLVATFSLLCGKMLYPPIRMVVSHFRSGFHIECGMWFNDRFSQMFAHRLQENGV